MPILGGINSQPHSNSISPPKIDHNAAPAQFQLTQVFYDTIPVQTLQHTQSQPAQQKTAAQKTTDQYENPFADDNQQQVKAIERLSSQLLESNRKIKEMDQQKTVLQKDHDKKLNGCTATINQLKSENLKLEDLITKAQEETRKSKEQEKIRELEIQKEVELNYADLMRTERRKTELTEKRCETYEKKVDVLLKENNDLMEQVNRLKDRSHSNNEREEMLTEINNLKKEYAKLKTELPSETRSPSQNDVHDQLEVYKLRKQNVIQTEEIDKLKKYIASKSSKPDEEQGIFEGIMGGIMRLNQAPDLTKLQQENKELKAKLIEAENTINMILEGGNPEFIPPQVATGRGMYGN